MFKFILLMFMTITTYANVIDVGIENEINDFKKESKKEKLSYKEMLNYLENSGDKNKIMILGVLYANDSETPDDFGEYIKADPLLSMKYLQQSYQMGNPRALSILGSLILYNDNLAKMDPDLSKAELFLSTAIKEGDLEARLLYATLLILKYEYEKAILELKEASELGDSSASLQLAFIYLKGIYSEKHEKMMVEKDLDIANYFLNIACQSKEKSDKVKEFCFSNSVETISK